MPAAAPSEEWVKNARHSRIAALRFLQSSAEEPSGNGGKAMAAVETLKTIPWWKEPTRDQWYAWWAAWLGWTLDAFDFTVFLLIMVPIAQEFEVPLAAVAFVLTIPLWMRLVGAV